MLYKDFAPTCFDPKGAFLDDRQDWLVVPVGKSRDSEALALSNFDAAWKILTGSESDDPHELVEIHSFNHWGPGWISVMIAHPSLADEVAELERRLENYPVLDEEDYSRREYEENIKLIEEAGKKYLNGKEPEDWASEIFGYLADPRNPTDDEIMEGLYDKSWLDEEYICIVYRDGERVYDAITEIEVIGRAESLWHKGLGERDVRVERDSEVIYRGGELRE